MASAEEGAGKSETKQSPSVSVHKVQVVAPFIAESGGISSSQENEDQQVCHTLYSPKTEIRLSKLIENSFE